MKSKRIVRGNFTTVPTGAVVDSLYQTNAVTEKYEKKNSFHQKVAAPSMESVIEARIFSEKHQT